MWYPIRSAAQRSMVHARFEALRIPRCSLPTSPFIPDDAGVGLAGSGLMIVNPPYGADGYLRDAYAAIHRESPSRAPATSKSDDSLPRGMHNRRETIAGETSLSRGSVFFHQRMRFLQDSNLWITTIYAISWPNCARP